MDGSILPIALGAFTVLYIAGWFCIEKWRHRPARAGLIKMAGQAAVGSLPGQVRDRESPAE
jgi:hypothetical protein